jgi:DNA-binding NarL/FixJ family response regulator
MASVSRATTEDRRATRVVVADDSAVLREGAVMLLEDAGFAVVAQASDPSGLLRKVRAHKPDVAIIDVRMTPGKGDDGMQAALELHRELPGVGILLFSGYVADRCFAKLLSAGASGVGYLLKDRVHDVSVLADAVRRVAAGETVLDPEVAAQLTHVGSSEAPLASLTAREREVLERMAQGHTNRAIAGELFMSERAVERHVTSIFTKLDLPASVHGHRRVLAVLAYLDR